MGYSIVSSHSRHVRHSVKVKHSSIPLISLGEIYDAILYLKFIIVININNYYDKKHYNKSLNSHNINRYCVEYQHIKQVIPLKWLLFKKIYQFCKSQSQFLRLTGSPVSNTNFIFAIKLSTDFPPYGHFAHPHVGN